MEAQSSLERASRGEGLGGIGEPGQRAIIDLAQSHLLAYAEIERLKSDNPGVRGRDRFIRQIADALGVEQARKVDILEAIQALLAPERTSAEALPQPHRAVEVDIHIGADDMTWAVRRLVQMATSAEERGKILCGASGSPDAGTSIDVAMRPEQTSEKYHAELLAYLEARRGAEQSKEEASDGGKS